MENRGPAISRHGIENQGLVNLRSANWNLPPAQLYEESVRRAEGWISADGAAADARWR